MNNKFLFIPNFPNRHHHRHPPKNNENFNNYVIRFGSSMKEKIIEKAPLYF